MSIDTEHPIRTAWVTPGQGDLALHVIKRLAAEDPETDERKRLITEAALNIGRYIRGIRDGGGNPDNAVTNIKIVDGRLSAYDIRRISVCSVVEVP